MAKALFRLLTTVGLLTIPLFARGETAVACRDYALSHPGDATRGQALFHNSAKTACLQCHTVDGSAKRAGPELLSIGGKFPRASLIRAVLEPSAEIAVGYEAVQIETKSGESHMGTIKQAGQGWIELMAADAKPVRIAEADILKREDSRVSLMPEGLASSLSLEEFADLIAYLETLKQAPETGGGPQTARTSIPVASKAVAYEPFFTTNIRLNHPLWTGAMPGHPSRYVVLEHFGKAWIVEKTGQGADAQTVLLDLSGSVRTGGATGLLGLAFHPHFTDNRKYYLQHQVVENGIIYTIVDEWRMDAGFRSDSGEPPRLLFKIAGSTQDHHGGGLEFGPDGLLYIGMGDTGPQRDPQGHGQDRGTLLGKMLRVDVDHTDPGLPYAIPASNPFRNTPGTRPEIWALGFREPWRFTFDSVNGDLWVGDVGQDRYEEVTLVRAGENHGWNVFEGFNAFSEACRRTNENYIPPVFSYPHSVGVSITGGYVYHGTRAPRMQGWYICADFETRRIWALSQTNRLLREVVEIGRAPSRAVSFMQDRDGELYLVGYDDGIIRRLGLEAVDPVPREVQIIAETSEKSPVTWRYTEAAPAAGWREAGFDDTQWAAGPGGFGTRGTPGAVVRTEWHSSDIWLRREVVIPSYQALAKTGSLTLRLHHDEDAEVYINGIRAGQWPRWTSGYEEVALTPEAQAALHAGRNVIAVHCHQVSGGQYIDCGLVQYRESGR